MAKTNDQKTPSFSTAIDQAIESKLIELHTAMPAEIVAYDSLTSYAIVKPHFQQKYIDDNTPVSISTISGVPVLLPRTADSHLRLPIKKGDTGLLIFAERSLDKWVQNAKDVDPDDVRHHSLNDAVFIPGIFDQKTNIKGNARGDSLEIRNKTGFCEILTNGTLKIGNNKEELISLLQELVNLLASTTVVVVGGSSSGTYPLATAAQLSAIASRINSIKGA